MTLTGTAFAEDAASCALAAGRRLDGRVAAALGCARSPPGASRMIEENRSPAATPSPKGGGHREATPDLRERLAAAREREQARHRPAAGRRAMASGYGMAVRLAIEMVAALGVAVFLGLWIDGELGSAPLFLIVLLIMGMGAGVLNVYRAVGGLQPAAPDGSKGEAERGG